MQLVGRSLIFFVVIASAYPAVITTDTHAQATTDDTIYGPAQTCDVSSTLGSSICNLTTSGPVGAGAQAQATAGIDGIAVLASAGALGGSAEASSTASYDSLVVVEGGNGSGLLVGRYIVGSTLDGGDLSASIVQGDATTQFGGFPVSATPNPILLSSHFSYGVPFEFSMSLRVDASDFGSNQEFMQADFEQLMFTDQNGNAVALIPVPEPGSLGVFIVLISLWALRHIPLSARPKANITARRLRP